MARKKLRSMDGERVRNYLSQDVDALLSTYRQFETLLPHSTQEGAAHRGEDGRYVESLIRSYLVKYLPSCLKVSTGFILRPAVKTGTNGRERRGESDSHSGQLDIIILDSEKYPAFQKFDVNVIVPPEGVIGIISVKKHLRGYDVVNECKALRLASELCRCLDQNGNPIRGPFLSLVSIKCPNKSSSIVGEWVFKQVKEAYSSEELPRFDDVIGYIGLFEQGSAFKTRPKGNLVKEAKFVWHSHKEGNAHLGLQFILTGLLSVYYDPSRSNIRRPGYTGFESGRPHEAVLGKIAVKGLR